MGKHNSRKTGGGQVFGAGGWSRQPEAIWAQPHILLSNFDINGPELKDRHKAFLSDSVARALKDNPDARVTLIGYASKSGEDADNIELSAERAAAVQAHLLSQGVAPQQFQTTVPLGFGERASRSKSNEDAHDRAVALLLSFPVTIHSVRLKTDDGQRSLRWEDVIGYGGTDHRWIDKINIEVEAFGAPRTWNTVNAPELPVMPTYVDVKLQSRPPGKVKGGATITSALPWVVPQVGQGSDPDRTAYRLSRPVSEAGRFLDVKPGRFSELATVRRLADNAGEAHNNSANDFRKALGWASRGDAIQKIDPNTGDESWERPDARRLLYAGGMEVLEVAVTGRAARPEHRVTKNLIRSPADVFYYSGNGKKDGSLVDDQGEPWISPVDLYKYVWTKPLDVDVLILAAPWVLNIDSGAGPGLQWAKLLKAKGGPLTAILGYRAEAPAWTTAAELAKQMAERIRTSAAGWKDDHWVRAWLQLNGDHEDNRGRKTWNAVGMAGSGYWWIRDRDNRRDSKLTGVPINAKYVIDTHSIP
jgi:OmpA family